MFLLFIARHCFYQDVGNTALPKVLSHVHEIGNEFLIVINGLKAFCFFWNINNTMWVIRERHGYIFWNKSIKITSVPEIFFRIMKWVLKKGILKRLLMDIYCTSLFIMTTEMKYSNYFNNLLENSVCPY